MKNLNQFLTLMIGLLSVLFLASFTASVLESTIAFYVIAAVLLVGGLKERKVGYAYEDVSPDLSAITKWIGKNRKSLYKRLYNKMDIANDITLVPNIKDSLILPNLSIENGPGPYTGDFYADGNDLTYGDRTLKVEKFQRDLKIHPSKYRTTYLSEERKRGEDAKNMTIPFAEFTSKAIIDHNASRLNNETAFFGIGKAGFTPFNVATAYVGDGTEYITFAVGERIKFFKVIAATTAGQTPVTHPLRFQDARSLAIVVGLGTKIKAGRTSGEISRVSSTGSLSTDALDKFTEVWRRLPSLNKNEGATMYCSVNSMEYLLDDMVSKVNKYTESDSKVLFLPKTNKKCIIQPASWMGDSEQLICTPKSNLMMGTDLIADFGVLKAIEQMHHVDLSITGVLGFNYEDGDTISMNDM